MMNSNKCDKLRRNDLVLVLSGGGVKGGRLSPGPPTKTNPWAAVFFIFFNNGLFQVHSLLCCWSFLICLFEFCVYLNRQAMKAAGSKAGAYSQNCYTKFAVFVWFKTKLSFNPKSHPKPTSVKQFHFAPPAANSLHLILISKLSVQMFFSHCACFFIKV